MNTFRTKRIYDTVKWGVLYSFFIMLFNIAPFIDPTQEKNIPWMIISAILIVLFFLPAYLQKQYEINVQKNFAAHASESVEYYYTNLQWKIWTYRILKFMFFLAWGKYPGLMSPTENRKNTFSDWGWGKKRGKSK